MAKELFERAKDFFSQAAATEEGKAIIKEHREVFQFEIKGEEPFYVELGEGKFGVEKGRYKEDSLMDLTPLQIDRTTLLEIFSGKIRPVRAMEERRMSLTAGSYEGSQITMLMRIGQDLMREKIIREFNWEEKE